MSPAQDTIQIKEKILLLLRRRGPSLPVHISGEMGMSILFSSVFLSELLSDKKVKISHLRVGSSPLYFIPGQEYQLEKFSQYLKSREKDAFALLRDKKILRDKDQEPAIRVALRSINDFAIPFRKGDEIYWKYLTAREDIPKETKKLEIEKKIEIKEVPKEEKGQEELRIFEKEEIKPELKPLQDSKKISPIKKKIVKKVPIKKTIKVDEKFFNKVKAFIASENIIISDIESYGKKELALRVQDKGQEKLLVAYNKKRINEFDIIKAHKKASEIGLRYIILSLGEPVKKITNFIEAVRRLEGMGKV
ncbi:MAG: hypothetical protein ABIB79_01685 [archaeon]